MGAQFQGFNWESCKRDWYMEIAPKAAELAACGITAVWLPPPTESVSPEGKGPTPGHVSWYECIPKTAFTVLFSQPLDYRRPKSLSPPRVRTQHQGM